VKLSDVERDLELVILRRRVAAEGVMVLELGDAHRKLLPRWSPGAHIDLRLANGLVRQYSLCGDPAHECWKIGVLMEPGSRGGSTFIHNELREGTTVGARGPRNHFALVERAAYRFVAGGIGITPLLPMIVTVERAGADWRLLYGGRTRDSMAFVDVLARYGEHVEIHPQDEYGLLDLDAALADLTAEEAVYCCGPEPLLGAVEALLGDHPAGSLHVERFAPKDIAIDRAGRPFEVEFSRSGLRTTVAPGQTILAAAEEAGIGVPCSCTEGICGTCETVVLEGEIDHRDSVLAPDERAANTVMMICVSRARSSRLVLDL
jgi:ferredoxin-NADP reductase